MDAAVAACGWVTSGLDAVEAGVLDGAVLPVELDDAVDLDEDVELVDCFAIRDLLILLSEREFTCEYPLNISEFAGCEIAARLLLFGQLQRLTLPNWLLPIV